MEEGMREGHSALALHHSHPGCAVDRPSIIILSRSKWLGTGNTIVGMQALPSGGVSELPRLTTT